MFAARFHLVHEWRKFLFTDPGCPPRCCRAVARQVAEELFHDEATGWSPVPRGSWCALRQDAHMTDPVLLDVTDGVATITLNRPDAMNSLDVATKEALLDAVRSVADDAAVRCVVLTGTGRAFCVGQDLKQHIEILESGAPDQLFRTVEEHYNPIVTTLAGMAKPVVAAVNGVAAGAGASLAFACDLRILADTAGFNLAFAGVALSCDTGSSFTLQRLVGPARAIELLYQPRTIKADEALSLGLATRVVPAADLTDEVGALAASLAAGPTVAYGAIRRSVAYAAGHTLRGGRRLRVHDDDPHRRHRRPPRRRPRLRQQGEAGLPGAVTHRRAGRHALLERASTNLRALRCDRRGQSSPADRPISRAVSRPRRTCSYLARHRRCGAPARGRPWPSGGARGGRRTRR